MPLSTFLNAGTVTQLRGLAWMALSDVGAVYRGTVTGDLGGGGSISWGPATDSSVPCRVDPVRAGDQNETVAERLDERTTHVITTPPATDVSTNDRFVVVDWGTFEVTAVRARTGELTRVFEAVEVS